MDADERWSSAPGATSTYVPPAPDRESDADLGDLSLRLGSLARNLRWAWDDHARALLAEIAALAPDRNDLDPFALVANLDPTQLEAIAADPRLVRDINLAHRSLVAYLFAAPSSASSQPGVLACFSMEWAIADCLPIFAGGLGTVAGEYLKAASDLNLPAVGVGLLYGERSEQRVDSRGNQYLRRHRLDPNDLPIEPARGHDGAPVEISLTIDGRDVVARVWRVDVGRCPLLLLDTDVPTNTPADRAITRRLYGGDTTTRLCQEILLGFGGFRALVASGMSPNACHLNEGHSALAAVAMLRHACAYDGRSPHEVAAELATRLVFTTHSPVAIAHDYFPPEFVARHIDGLVANGAPTAEQVLAWGRVDPEDRAFCMTALAIRLCGRSVAVSAPHEAVTRKMWARLWARCADDEEVPIVHIRNGLHPGTWVSPLLRYARRDTSAIELPTAALWELHQSQRVRLIRAVEHRTEAARRRKGRPSRPAELDPAALTIGIVGRFVGYKRPNLLLRDADRLAALLTRPDRPMQVVVAGEAHPHDEEGTTMLRELVLHSRDPRFAGRLVFVEGFDLALDRLFVQGVDLWLNTPVPPLEACGVASVKAAANGALVISTYDGWWREACISAGGQAPFGWTIGGSHSEAQGLHDDGRARDAHDAEALYSLLEGEVSSMFYERSDGIPRPWVRRMKLGITSVQAAYGAERMVREYAALVGLAPVRDDSVDASPPMVNYA